MKEGFDAFKKNTSPVEGVLASEVLNVLNGLQKKKAIRQFSEKHPDREVDPNTMGNEIMGEWVESGSAEAFAREFGDQDLEQLRRALREIDAPNVASEED